MIKKFRRCRDFTRYELKPEPISQDTVINVILALTLLEGFQEMGFTCIQKLWLIDVGVQEILDHRKCAFAILVENIDEIYNARFFNILTQIHQGLSSGTYLLSNAPPLAEC